MNRQDLEFLGVRLLGLYFMVTGVASLPNLLVPDNAVHWAYYYLPPVLYLLAGLLLAIGTNRVCGWLGDRGPSR